MFVHRRSLCCLLLRRQGGRTWHHAAWTCWWVCIVTADEVENAAEPVWRR